MNITELVESAKTHLPRERESVLPTETRSQLDAFVTYLTDVESKTTATARSYRSYIVTALTNHKSFADQTSDVKSAARAFARFQDSK